MCSHILPDFLNWHKMENFICLNYPTFALKLIKYRVTLVLQVTDAVSYDLDVCVVRVTIVMSCDLDECVVRDTHDVM